MPMSNEERAILAGGCFWGVEELIRNFPGVLRTEVGYTGGQTKDPVYDQVKMGKTGHAEAIEIIFDPTATSYERILHFFFKLHDPTTLNRQGNDRGTQYRSSIFYVTPEQKETAERVVKEAQRHWKDPIVTTIEPAGVFYSAEDYHQDYLQKNPNGYTCHYIRE